VKNRFTPVAAIQHMINRPRIFHSQLASHRPSLNNAQFLSIVGTDPFVLGCLHAGTGNQIDKHPMTGYSRPRT
jgi:hypothetical protein